MKKTLAACAALFAFSGAAAFAQIDQFTQLDADGSGGLSLQEIQTAVPQVTSSEFKEYDTDKSGELSSSEFSAWLSGDSGESY
jgi:Ca2+-binding EF-hand superfamily protein